MARSAHYLIACTLIAGAMLALVGCSHYAPTPPLTDPFTHWRRAHDYYSLLEIVDTRIDPRWSKHVSKADVIQYLGEGMDDPDSYPKAGPNLWVYSSSRPIPVGSYLLVEFDGEGSVKSVDWASE